MPSERNLKVYQGPTVAFSNANNYINSTSYTLTV